VRIGDHDHFCEANRLLESSLQHQQLIIVRLVERAFVNKRRGREEKRIINIGDLARYLGGNRRPQEERIIRKLRSEHLKVVT
jgi:hypothetical protein